jgi:hypothetical protein
MNTSASRAKRQRSLAPFALKRAAPSPSPLWGGSRRAKRSPGWGTRDHPRPSGRRTRPHPARPREGPDGYNDPSKAMLRPSPPHFDVGGELTPGGGGFGKGERLVFLGGEQHERPIFTRKTQDDPRHIILHRRRKTPRGFEGFFEQLGHIARIISRWTEGQTGKEFSRLVRAWGHEPVTATQLRALPGDGARGRRMGKSRGF